MTQGGLTVVYCLTTRIRSEKRILSEFVTMQTSQSALHNPGGHSLPHARDSLLLLCSRAIVSQLHSNLIDLNVVVGRLTVLWEAGCSQLNIRDPSSRVC